ncbi:MAG: zinc-dependent metalloprotease, partial [Planctomycetota bacterium]
GTLDFSRAYARGIGLWDVHAVHYAYHQPAPGVEEAEALASIVQSGIDQGLLFISDADARPAGSAHPRAHLWDNGADPVAALRETMAVRRVAIDGFGRRNLAPDRPLALLHEVYVPVHLHHRYQVEAAVKIVGGLDYRYTVNGDGQGGARPVDADWQLEALAALLECLEPETLRVPDHVIDLLVPRPFGYGGNRELLASTTAPAFDPSVAETVAADLVIGLLLEPHRAARLMLQTSRLVDAPGLEDVVAALLDRVFAVPIAADRSGDVQRGTQQVLVERMIGLAEDETAAPAVRAIVDDQLPLLLTRLGRLEAATARDAAHFGALAVQIQRHRERQVTGPRERPRIDPAPPGSPIGSFGPAWGECACGGPDHDGLD